MLLPCEVVVNYFLPAVRAKTIKILSREYGFTQTRIARALGLTQAAVSKHLSFKYTDKVKEIAKEKDVDRIAKRLAKEIASGTEKKEIIRILCESCTSLKGKGIVCKLHRMLTSPSSS